MKIISFPRIESDYLLFLIVVSNEVVLTTNYSRNCNIISTLPCGIGNFVRVILICFAAP